MAIDNATKRRSIAGISTNYGITPNSLKNKEWRKSVANNYASFGDTVTSTLVKIDAQETSGFSLADTSGNGRNITLTSTANLSSISELNGPGTRFTRSVHLNGTDSDDSAGFSLTLGGTSPYTIMIWFKGNVAADNSAITRVIVANPDTIGMTWSHTSPTYTQAAYRGSGGFPVASFGAVPHNEWHFWAQTYDGANIRTYIDNVLKNTTATAVSITDATSWFVGAANNCNWCGLQIENSALSTTQMEPIMNMKDLSVSVAGNPVFANGIQLSM